jgi:hypothetical protein
MISQQGNKEKIGKMAERKLLRQRIYLFLTRLFWQNNNLKIT